MHIPPVCTMDIHLTPSLVFLDGSLRHLLLRSCQSANSFPSIPHQHAGYHDCATQWHSNVVLESAPKGACRRLDSNSCSFWFSLRVFGTVAWPGVCFLFCLFAGPSWRGSCWALVEAAGSTSDRYVGATCAWPPESIACCTSQFSGPCQKHCLKKTSSKSTGQRA